MKMLSKLLSVLIGIATFASGITLFLEIAYFFDLKILGMLFTEICIIFSLIYTKRNLDFMIYQDELWKENKTRRSRNE
ncbi:hypothetical protein [Ligilactobacillus salivarius]|uniref:Uncharacterized protein n=1 Tax=Ligilactobacillus salivarius TaxID=1624 RepID=A0A1V9REB0_9LACO|nr:hypothetical protein [Ligilactobacillus salivarius]OQQ91336.1 hypothetical protein B6U56_02695 [Ligilactobacillus salivarius]